MNKNLLRAVVVGSVAAPAAIAPVVANAAPSEREVRTTVEGNARFDLASGDRVSLSVIGIDDDAIGWLNLRTNAGEAAAKVLCATGSVVDGVRYAAIGVIFNKSTIPGIDRFATGVEYIRDGERRGRDQADGSRLQLGSPACPTAGFAAPADLVEVDRGDYEVKIR
ncbi:MAG: hypothetical protein ACT4QF_24045 [Sporichthyaceae bacterium]